MASKVRILFELGAVSVDLAVQKLLKTSPFVPAGFIIDHPAHPGFVDKTPIQDDPRNVALPPSRERVFAQIVPIAGLENPPTARIAMHAQQRIQHSGNGLLQPIRRHSVQHEPASIVRLTGTDRGFVPGR